MAALFSHPGKARVNRTGLRCDLSRAKLFAFEEWESAIAYCRSKDFDDVDFLLPFPGVARTVRLPLRAVNPHPLIDYPALG